MSLRGTENVKNSNENISGFYIEASIRGERRCFFKKESCLFNFNGLSFVLLATLCLPVSYVTKDEKKWHLICKSKSKSYTLFTIYVLKESIDFLE